MPVRRKAAQQRDFETAEAIIKLSYLAQQRIAEVAAAHGFSNTQVRALAILRDRALTMGELGSVMGLEKSSLTILVDRAVDAGLLQRSPSQRDRRAIEVTLTAQGRNIDSALRAQITSRIIAMIDDGIGAAERDTCTRLIRAVVDPLLPEPK